MSVVAGLQLGIDPTLLNMGRSVGRDFFVWIAFHYGRLLCPQRRLRHPHVLPDGSAKFSREFPQLRLRFRGERSRTKDFNLRAKLFNLGVG